MTTEISGFSRKLSMPESISARPSSVTVPYLRIHSWYARRSLAFRRTVAMTGPRTDERTYPTTLAASELYFVRVFIFELPHRHVTHADPGFVLLFEVWPLFAEFARTGKAFER